MALFITVKVNQSGEGRAGRRELADGACRPVFAEGGCLCNVQSVTLACSWLLTPLVATPSALHIFCKSLFRSVLERAMTVGAICCRLDDAMARVPGA
jgi:hypothetical protein